MTGPASLVTVAHGTRRAAGNQVARDLTVAAAARAGLAGRCSFVELAEPLFADVVRAVARPSVVVPLLLSTGYHVRHDLPRAVRAAAGPVVLGPPLGPHRLVAEAQADRLLAAGATPGAPVVMVAAGSRDPATARDLARAARLLGAAWGGPARVATLGGRGPRVAEVVRPGEAVSPYLLAPGHFADRLAEQAAAARAGTVAGVLGAHPALAELVAARAAAALAAPAA